MNEAVNMIEFNAQALTTLISDLNNGATLKAVKAQFDSEEAATIRTKKAMVEYIEGLLAEMVEPTVSTDTIEIIEPTVAVAERGEITVVKPTFSSSSDTIEVIKPTVAVAERGEIKVIKQTFSSSSDTIEVIKPTVTVSTDTIEVVETTIETAKDTAMPKVKKQYEEVLELLMANQDMTVAELMPQLLKVMKSQGGSGSGSTFRKDEQGRVTHVFCYYHKQWEQVKTDFQDGVEYGIKANTATGLNTMCKEGTSAWTKQNRAYKKAKENLLNAIANGETIDLPTELAKLETEKGQILPHSQAEQFSE